MKKHGKKYLSAKQKVEPKRYSLEDALVLLKDISHRKFDETVECHFNLGIDTKQSDQTVRGTVNLPSGLGKTVKVVVIARGEKIKEAQEAGADFTGGEDIINKIQAGWLDFDCIITTPDMMGMVGKLGKILGRRGLMPSPKTGTVTFDINKAVKEFKAGKVEFKADKLGNVHVPIGKISFEKEKLKENFSAIFEAINKSKPSSSKGIYLKNIALTTTMGPGVRLEIPH